MNARLDNFRVASDVVCADMTFDNHEVMTVSLPRHSQAAYLVVQMLQKGEQIPEKLRCVKDVAIETFRLPEPSVKLDAEGKPQLLNGKPVVVEEIKVVVKYTYDDETKKMRYVRGWSLNEVGFNEFYNNYEPLSIFLKGAAQ